VGHNQVGVVRNHRWLTLDQVKLDVAKGQPAAESECERIDNLITQAHYARHFYYAA
jgi:hypothetical protein